MFTVTTSQKRQIVDITDRVEDGLSRTGLVHLQILHTTCALTVADLDPGTDQDYLKALEQITPTGPWQHPHDPSHFPDHLWGALIGPSISLSFRNGKIQLGSWQRVIIIEFDGPRDRQIEQTVIKSS